MATLKIKFRPSSVKENEGTLFYQVLHRRIARQVATGYKLFSTEWDSHTAEVVVPLFDKSRKNYLLAVKEKIEKDIRILKNAIDRLEERNRPYTADGVVTFYRVSEKKDTLFVFMEDTIEELRQLGKVRTSETYAATRNSFIRFREGKDISLREIDSDWMLRYEAYLKAGNVCPNSSSFYLRNLRAVYNRAVEKGLTPQRFPFKHVYTGIDKTVKRAVSLKEIRRIRELDLELNSSQDYSRDMFLFSFYTRGMSFVDMAYLRKKDLNNGMLLYRRKKTGQLLSILWEGYMQEIIDKYDTGGTPYLLPIIRKLGTDERKQYTNAAHLINRQLKSIGEKLKLPIPLTMYVARHSWASIARSKNIPISIISEGMGHDSETTTQIYLTSLDTTAIDKANRLILKSL